MENNSNNYNPYNNTYQGNSENTQQNNHEQSNYQQNDSRSNDYQQSSQQNRYEQNNYQQNSSQSNDYQQSGQQNRYEQNNYQQNGGWSNDYQQNSRQDGYQQNRYEQKNYQQNGYQSNGAPQGNGQQVYGQKERKSKGSFKNFGVTLVKTVTIALVFGLVSAATATAVFRMSGVDFGIVDDADKEEIEKYDAEGQDDNNSAGTKDDAGVLQQTETDAVIGAVMDVSDIVENTMPCMVAISNTAEITYQGMWGQTYTQENESAGTGFIVKQDKQYIYIATNNHVVSGANKLEVQFFDGSIVEAQIKGTVASKDLAVITVAVNDIERETLREIRIATLGDANELEMGEAAIAIGNALGYGQSVTTGVISATGRSVTVQDASTGTYVVNNNLIQTNAAINPGNSGGALLNIEGEVIGINSVKYSDTSVEGIGYAIPINDAMLIINKMIEGEKIDESQSGYLGIQGQDSNLGAYVVEVFAGSAAEQAGIQKGDIITEFEGTDIATMSQLKELLSYYPAGAEVKFVVLRPQANEEYEELEIIVTLGDASILPQQ